MLEIRWHGRGGQGAVTAAILLAQAVINEGKYAQSFAQFGPERRGAPVTAFTRIDDKPINVRSQIYNPDVLVVLTPTLMTSTNITEGWKERGSIVINTAKRAEEIKSSYDVKGLTATVDATKIALEELRVAIVNTAILGSVVRATKLVELESINGAINDRFSGVIAERNVKAVKRAYDETQIV